MEQFGLDFEKHGGKIAQRKDGVSAADLVYSQPVRVNVHAPNLNIDDTNFETIGQSPHPDVNRSTSRTIREESPDEDQGGWTKAQQWGYAVLANSFNVCLALSGIMIVKCSNGGNRRVLGDFFLGLAVSIMLGDSLHHIMPEVLGRYNSTILRRLCLCVGCQPRHFRFKNRA